LQYWSPIFTMPWHRALFFQQLWPWWHRRAQWSWWVHLNSKKGNNNKYKYVYRCMYIYIALY
jgi:hypothetical protein